MIKIYPSLAATPETKWTKIIQQLEPFVAGFHCDIMEQDFVPQHGPAMTVAQVSIVDQQTSLPLFVHIMAQYPQNHIQQLRCKPNSIIAWHVESDADHDELIANVHKNNWRAGIAINPETNIEQLLPYLQTAEIFLVMSVHPGMSGQQYIPATTNKIAQLHNIITSNNSQTQLAIDGGINHATIGQAAKAGAVMFCVGGALAKVNNAEREIKALIDQANLR